VPDGLVLGGRCDRDWEWWGTSCVIPTSN